MRAITLHRPKGLSVTQQIEWEIAQGVPVGDCIFSHRPVGKSGYAKAGIGGRTQRIHRAIFQHHAGRELRADEEVRHTCHTPRCININHLRVGSHQDNMDDMVAAGRGRSGQRYGAKNSSAKFTEDEVRILRELYSAGSTQAELSRKYGVSDATISRIVRRINYP